MPKGVYAAASAMYADRFTVEVIANNVANGHSPGFRRAVPLRESFATMLAQRGHQGDVSEDGGAGVRHDGTYTVFQSGHLVETGDTFDAAITGSGFYLVDDGEQHYLTRQSHFVQDDAGLLMTDEGHLLVGQGGPIQIPPEAEDINIDRAGRIYAVIPTDVGPQRVFIEQLRVVEVADTRKLHGIGGQLFQAGEQEIVDSTDYVVRQGFLEEANVEPVKEMVEMIAAQRRYDAAQRVLKTQLEGGANYSELLRGVS